MDIWGVWRRMIGWIREKVVGIWKLIRKYGGLVEEVSHGKV